MGGLLLWIAEMLLVLLLEDLYLYLYSAIPA